MAKKKFDKDFKLNAVRLVHEGKLTVKQVSQDLGVGYSTLERWIREIRAHGEKSVFPGSGYLKPENERLRKLERENEILRRERDISPHLIFLTRTPTF